MILEILKKINSEVALVSIIYANNEIGTIQPVAKIGEIIKKFNHKLEIGNQRRIPRDFPKRDMAPRGYTALGPLRDWKLKVSEARPVLFHADACQAAGYLDMNINNLGVDLMTFNGIKIYSPRGIEVLYKRRGVVLEKGIRRGSGTRFAGWYGKFAGLAEALRAIDKKEVKRLTGLRDYFLDKIRKTILDARINGPLSDLCLPNNINISILGVTNEQLLLELDRYGIYVSSGSACTARSTEPPHVLKAIGIGKEYINGTLRLSLGRYTIKKDIDYVLRTLPKVVADLKKRYNKN